MVALDTGSDLFWVPCDCSQCAPTEGTTYASVCSLLIVHLLPISKLLSLPFLFLKRNNVFYEVIGQEDCFV